jgi:hypothetical protein
VDDSRRRRTNRSRGRSPSWRRLEAAQTREEAHLEQIVVVMPDRLRSLPLSAGGGGAADRPRFILPFFLASRTSPPPPSSMAQERPRTQRRCSIRTASASHFCSAGAVILSMGAGCGVSEEIRNLWKMSLRGRDREKRGYLPSKPHDDHLTTTRRDAVARNRNWGEIPPADGPNSPMVVGFTPAPPNQIRRR